MSPLRRLHQIRIAGLLTTVGLGVVMTGLIGGAFADQTRATALGRANLIAGSVLADEMTSGDIVSPEVARRAEEGIAERLASQGILGISVRRPDGTVIMSVGSLKSDFPVSGDSTMVQAFEGRAASEEVVDADGTAIIASYVPLELVGDGGELLAVAEIYQDPSKLAGGSGLRWALSAAAFSLLLCLYLLMMGLFRRSLEPSPSQVAGAVSPVVTAALSDI